MKTTEIKMSRLSIPESEYLTIKKEMKEHNEHKFIDYLNRIKLQRQDLKDRCFHLGIKNKDLKQQYKETFEALCKVKDHSKFLAEELGKINKELLDYKCEINCLKAKQYELIDSINDKNKEIDSLNHTIQSTNQSNSRYKAIIDDKIDEIAVLQGSIEELQISKKFLEESIDKSFELHKILHVRIGKMKTWKGRILNVFGWELHETPFSIKTKKQKQ